MITKTSVHACLALSVLAGLDPGEYAGAAAIAAEIGAPQNYLGKLLKQLAAQGILESQKGYGGGFKLRKDADKITLYDIVEPIEHVSRWNGCFLGRKRCSDHTPCAVHKSWTHVRDKYLGFLKGTSLKDIA